MEMDGILKDVNALVGVTGSFVCDNQGRIVARALPENFDTPSLETVGRTVSQTCAGLEATRRRKMGDLGMLFGQGQIIAKNVGEGFLCILCVRRVNVPLLNLTANVAAKKIHDMLKAAAAGEKKEPAAAAKAGTPAASKPLVAGSTREAAALTLVAAARDRKIVMRVMGDTAVRLRCPSASTIPILPEDDYLELAARGRQAGQVEELLKSMGYVSDTAFNTLYGSDRLRYALPKTGMPVDVALGKLISYHELDFSDRLHLDECTLSLADLLLSQLQIVKANDRDQKRVLALLGDHDLGAAGEAEAIDALLIAGQCADDWGWYKTVTMNLAKAFEAASGFLKGESLEGFQKRARRLTQMIEEAPKTLRWQVRARIGESRQWYQVPE